MSYLLFVHLFIYFKSPAPVYGRPEGSEWSHIVTSPYVGSPDKDLFYRFLSVLLLRLVVFLELLYRLPCDWTKFNRKVFDTDTREGCQFLGRERKCGFLVSSPWGPTSTHTTWAGVLTV